MKIPAIKKLVENYPIDALKAAEEAIVNEESLSIEVEGEDEGEQLTHVIAAIWILEKIYASGTDFKSALREYTGRVRESIN
jgi:hypothetical protein